MLAIINKIYNNIHMKNSLRELNCEKLTDQKGNSWLNELNVLCNKYINNLRYMKKLLKCIMNTRINLDKINQKKIFIDYNYIKIILINIIITILI